MGSADGSDLLLEAFALSPEQGQGKWETWREGRDLDRLDPADVRSVPLLAHRLEGWLAGDAAKAVLQGVCKRAWTRNQLTFRSLARAAGSLRAAGVERIVLIGPASWALLHAERKSIRPADSPEFLLARRDVARAAAALSANGWQLLPGQPEPKGETLDREHGVWLANAREERLSLAWRLAPCAPELAARREELGPLAPAEVQGIRLHLLGPEQMLLDILAGYRGCSRPDWRWDALALLAARPLDWNRLGRGLADDEIARRRLRQLREEWRIPVSERILEPKLGWFRQRLGGVWRDYLWHSWRAGQSPSWIRFALYCPRRWWKVFVTERAST